MSTWHRGGHVDPSQASHSGEEQLIEMHGKPNAVRLDNGSEFTSSAFTEWCEKQGIELRFIQPGKPD